MWLTSTEAGESRDVVAPGAPPDRGCSVGEDRVAARVALIAAGIAILGLLVLASPLHMVGALVFVGAVAVLSLARPKWAIWLVLLLFAVHPLLARVASANFGVTGNALVIAFAWKEVALGCVLLVAVVRIASDYRHGWRPKPMLSVLDLMAVGLIVLVVFGVAGRRDAMAVNEARLLLFPVGVYAALRLSPLDTASYFRAATVVAAGIAVFGILQSTFLGWGWVTTYWGTPNVPAPATFMATNVVGPRAAATYTSPNELGFALIVFSLMAAALIITRPERTRWVVLPLIAILVGLAMSFSRSAVASAALCISLVAVVGVWRFAPDRRRVAILLAAAIIPAAALSGWVYVSRGGVSQLAATFIWLSSGAGGGDDATSTSPGAPPATDPSALGHITSIGDGWALVNAHPFGLGLGRVGARVVPGTNDKPQMIFESWYLTMGVMLGWPGLIWTGLFPLALLIAAITALRRRRQLTGLVLLGLSVSVAAVSFLLPTMMEPQLAMLPWAVGALAVADAPQQPDGSELAPA